MSDAILRYARTLAQEAGQLARRLRAQRGADFVSTKGRSDFVTLADQNVEDYLRAAITAQFPNHGILGEEYGGALADPLWIIDPIDGTTNYLKGLPDWGVCISVAQGGKLTHGVISCPDHGLLASAEAGKGAWLNDIRMDPAREGAIPLVQLGFSTRTPLAEHLNQIERLIALGADYRRSGAACVGLLSVAAGWSDVFYERHLKLWDAAAGLVLVSETGGAAHHAALPDFYHSGSAVLALNKVAVRRSRQWAAVFETTTDPSRQRG